MPFLGRRSKTIEATLATLPTAEQQLAATRAQIDTLTGQIARLRGESGRCNTEASTHAAKRTTAAEARQRLESLHAARVTGEHVDDADLAAAEAEHDTAIAEAVKAVPAESGCRQAAMRFEVQAGELAPQVQELRAAEASTLTAILRQRVDAAHSEFDEALAAFVAAYVEHHGSIGALASLARAIGVNPPSIGALPIRDHGAGLVEIVGTARQEGAGPWRIVNVGAQIVEAAGVTEASLRAELLQV